MYDYREIQVQQHGAEAARGAHNPEVTGSRPVAAIVFFKLLLLLPPVCEEQNMTPFLPCFLPWDFCLS